MDLFKKVVLGVLVFGTIGVFAQFSSLKNQVAGLGDQLTAAVAGSTEGRIISPVTPFRYEIVQTSTGLRCRTVTESNGVITYGDFVVSTYCNPSGFVAPVIESATEREATRTTTTTPTDATNRRSELPISFPTTNPSGIDPSTAAFYPCNGNSNSAWDLCKEVCKGVGGSWQLSLSSGVGWGCTASAVPGVTNPTFTTVFRSGISSSEITRTLSQGLSNDEQVRLLQDRLKELGFLDPIINSSGNYGLQTRRAVEDFQRSNGLAVDGAVGPNTRDALNGRTSREGSSVSKLIKINQSPIYAEILRRINAGEKNIKVKDLIYQQILKQTGKQVYRGVVPAGGSTNYIIYATCNDGGIGDNYTAIINSDNYIYVNDGMWYDATGTFCVENDL